MLEAAEGRHRLIFRIAALLGLRWGDLALERRRLYLRQTGITACPGSPVSRAGAPTPGLVGGLRPHRPVGGLNPKQLQVVMRHASTQLTYDDHDARLARASDPA